MKRWTRWCSKCSGLWAKRLALFLIAIYRSTFSGLVGGVCRFEPSCSFYAEKAFKEHSLMTAFWLTLKRLLKCHPLGPFGFDPVPPPPKARTLS